MLSALVPGPPPLAPVLAVPPDNATAAAAAVVAQATDLERASLSAYRAQLLRDGVTYNHSAVELLPPLPVLRANNTRLHPEWHRYTQRLYGARGLAQLLPLDLNELSWFYWFAPLRLQSLYLCDWEDHYAQAPYGTPWTGGLAAWSWGPEHLVRRLGFFVHRPRWTATRLAAAPRLEVTPSPTLT